MAALNASTSGWTRNKCSINDMSIKKSTKTQKRVDSKKTSKKSDSQQKWVKKSDWQLKSSKKSQLASKKSSELSKKLNKKSKKQSKCPVSSKLQAKYSSGNKKCTYLEDKEQVGKKLSTYKRLKLSPQKYRHYVKWAQKYSLEKFSPISSLKAPVVPAPRPWLAKKTPSGFDRLSLTPEEYRQKVFNIRPRKKIAGPKKIKKSEGTQPLTAFRRLSLSSKEYKQVVQKSSSGIKSLLPVEKPNKNVCIPGRKQLGLKDRMNFSRLAMTKAERKQAKVYKQCKDNISSDSIGSLKQVKKQKKPNNWSKNKAEFNALSMTKKEYRAWRQKKANQVKFNQSKVNKSKAIKIVD